MASHFVGSMVSIDCGDILGTYQGLLDAVSTSTQALTIVQAFHNGVKCHVPRVTIAAADIQDLKIVKDAVSVRESGPTANVHVRPLQDIVSKPLIDGDSFVSDNVLNGLASLQLKQSEMSNVSCDPVHKALVKQKKADCSNRGRPSNDVKKSAVATTGGVHGSASQQSPSRHTPGETETGTGKLCPIPKANTGRNKMVHTASPVNGVTGMKRNDYVECDNSSTRKRTTSASENGAFYKNSVKGSSSKLSSSIREEDCFSMPVDSFASSDFDFEKNLAMFNKRAVFDEIERDLEMSGANSYSKPTGTAATVIRSSEPKYRCDENVLPTQKVTYRQIAVTKKAELSAPREFVTDAGLVIPSVDLRLREKLYELAECAGFTLDRQIEMIGRSTAEMVLQLLGGSNRFDPKNSHQRPRVVVLCGCGQQSAIAINCARHLICRSIFVTVLQPESLDISPEIESEMKLIEFGSRSNRTSSCSDLPRIPVDMIISALDSHGSSKLSSSTWYRAAVNWANQNKAPILAIDPPVGKIGVVAKWSIAVALPFAYDETCGQIYLCDLGLPQRLYRTAGLSAYQSPFAHKFIIPIYVS